MNVSATSAGRSLTATSVLVRLYLRLDRLRLVLWIGGLTALVLVSAASVDGLYRSEAEITGYFSLLEGNPTLTAINGPGFGAEAPSIGAILVNEVLLFGAIGFALMGVFLVVRHTRAEEEAERSELLGARVLGRHAGLFAATIVGAGASIIGGVASWIGLLLLGFAPVGSAALCAAMAFTGLLFAGIAAVAAQLTTSARGSLGIAIGALGASYVLRAVGDLGTGALSWVSPLGWGHRVRPFAGEQWWVLAVQLALTAGLFAAALGLADRRDLGGGLIVQRPGPPRASKTLTGPLGLAVRLQRGAVLGWSAGLFALGAVYGSVGSDIEQLFEDTPQAEDVIALTRGASLVDSFVAYTLGFGAMLASGFVIASVLRLRTEESGGRVEVLLATRTTRVAWAASHATVAVAGAALLLALSGLGTGISLAVATGEPGEVMRVTLASLTLVPAVWVMAAIPLALFGWRSRAGLAAWGALAMVVVVGLFGDLLQLPDVVRWTSPVDVATGAPAEAFDPVAAGVLVAIAVALAALGLVGVTRRDLPDP